MARLLQERQQLRAPRVMPQVLSFFGSNLREANVTIDTLLFFAQPGVRYQHTAAQGVREACGRRPGCARRAREEHAERAWVSRWARTSTARSVRVGAHAPSAL